MVTWRDRKEYDRQRYLANKEEFIAKSRERGRGLAARNRKFLNDVKSDPCADCGIKYPPYVMDFDHVHGEKKFGLGMMSGKGVSIARLQEEINKCDVVCSNCHRIRTHNRRSRGAIG
jgi:hypothetical protein